MRFARPAAAFVAVTVAAACGDSTDPQPQPDTTPASLTVVSGNNQTGTVGETLSAALTARVSNADGDPLAGVTVAWSVVAGGGSLGSMTSSTDAQGHASTTYTLGANPGTNTIRASVGSSSLTTDFTATATPAMDVVPASIAIGSGDNQSTTVSTELANPLVVRVENAAGEALSGVDVDWAVASGGGSLGSSATTTNAQGQASTTYTLGPAPGPNTITAEVRSNTTLAVTFTAIATAAAPTADVIVNNNFFDPKSIGVAAGGTVTWTWAQNAIGHNVTWVGGGFANSATQSMGTHEVMFPSSGSFDYYCTIHGTPTSGMRGTVVVP